MEPGEDKEICEAVHVGGDCEKDLEGISKSFIGRVRLL